MAPYFLSDSAEIELSEIWAYYVRSEGERLADRQLASLYDIFDLLAERPLIGVTKPGYPLGMHSFPVPNTRYIVFYFPRADQVEIAHVVHGSRQIARLLG